MQSSPARNDAPTGNLRETEHGSIVAVQTSIYSVEVIMRTAHRFTGRSFVHISRTGEDCVEIEFRPLPGTDLATLPQEFCNELLDSALRDVVARESRAERDLILAHALSRHPILNRDFETAAAFTDPVGLLNQDRPCKD